MDGECYIRGFHFNLFTTSHQDLGNDVFTNPASGSLLRFQALAGHLLFVSMLVAQTSRWSTTFPMIKSLNPVV